MDCFECMFISTQNLAYLIPIFSLVSLLLYFFQYLLQEYEEHET